MDQELKNQYPLTSGEQPALPDISWEKSQVKSCLRCKNTAIEHISINKA